MHIKDLWGRVAKPNVYFCGSQLRFDFAPTECFVSRRSLRFFEFCPQTNLTFGNQFSSALALHAYQRVELSLSLTLDLHSGPWADGTKNEFQTDFPQKFERKPKKSHPKKSRSHCLMTSPLTIDFARTALHGTNLTFRRLLVLGLRETFFP